MLQANVLYKKLETKTIYLTVYDDGTLIYAHFTDSNSIILELLQKYDELASVHVEIVGDHLWLLSDVNEFIEAVAELGIDVSFNYSLDPKLSIQEAIVAENSMPEWVNEEVGEYTIVIDEPNSYLLVSALLDNGYIVSWKRKNEEVEIIVHGATTVSNALK